MDHHQQCKKRRLSTSGSPRSPKIHTCMKRSSDSSSMSENVDELTHRDSGISSFLDEDSTDYVSPESKHRSFLETEEVLDDSPIIKNMGKMSVVHVDSNSKKPSLSGPSTSKEKKVLLVSNVPNQLETFVSGCSVAHYPISKKFRSPKQPEEGFFQVRPRLFDYSGVQENETGMHDRNSPRESWSGYQRDEFLLEHHPQVTPEMRSILLEWIMEVCRCHNLLRKTYHMALDFIDRFLSFTENLPKGILQLLGIAALSLAAKIEEIFPPKLAELAYVTDGANDEDEIKSMEKAIFSVLGTSFMPLTVGECVAEFLHLAGMTGQEEAGIKRHENTDLHRESQLPLELYTHICRLVDLAMLDATSLGFSYKQIAASAIYFIEGGEETIRILYESGCLNFELAPCIHWMKSFAEVESELDPVRVYCSVRLDYVQWPHVQSHDFDMDVFTKAMELKHRNFNSIEQVSDQDVTNVVDLDVTVENEAPPPPLMSSTPQRLMQSPEKVLSSAFVTPPDSQIKRRPVH